MHACMYVYLCVYTYIYIYIYIHICNIILSSIRTISNYGAQTPEPFIAHIDKQTVCSQFKGPRGPAQVFRIMQPADCNHYSCNHDMLVSLAKLS